MSEKIFRIYIDDSGEKEYTGTSRHFVYAGCVVAAEDQDAIINRLRQAKEKVFGTADVEVKANWILQPRERERRYFEPFGITAEGLDSFTDDWYEIMAGSEMTYVAAVIDKIQMQDKYIILHNPSPTAYQYLL